MTTLSDAETDDRPGPLLWSILAGATAVQVVATAAALALTAISPAVSKALGIGPHFVGYQISLIYLAGIFASAYAGATLRRFGALRVEQLCLACFAAGLLCFSAARLDLLILGSVFIGIGYGYQNPAASQMLMGITPARWRNLVFSIKQAGVPMGGMLASLAFPFLALFFGWQGGLALSAIVPVVLACLLQATQGDLHPVKTASLASNAANGFLADQRLLLADPNLRALATLGFLYSGVQLSLSAFAVTTLVENAGWSILAAGSLAAAMQLAGAIGRVSWGYLADRLGGGFVTLCGLGIAGGLSAVALFWLDVMPAPLQVLLMTVNGALWLGWNGVLLAETARHAPAGRAGAMTGGVLIYTFLGVMVGPSTFALVAGALGSFPSTFALFGGCGFAGAVVAFRRARRG
ncbi:MFS transporter [Aureimonas sp. SA4125]|uniref:MFS transporter n=1 Tax=Aureimonas sp. SA4125 TaxID=2826993 RepID=UPI001CC820DD|nr:MFS transporter [Aureimonas sp. SA4125]BDA84370.1 MFS transporter [Aureimonas sp. SA4125]